MVGVRIGWDTLGDFPNCLHGTSGAHGGVKTNTAREEERRPKLSSYSDSTLEKRRWPEQGRGVSLPLTPFTCPSSFGPLLI